jgi:hypothetical protein
MTTRLEARRSKMTASGRAADRERHAGESLVSAMLRLQQTAGNRATTAMVQRFAAPAKPGPAEEVKSVPNVRVVDMEVLPQPMKRGGPVYVLWTLANDGTGPTRPGDELWVNPSYEHTSHSNWDKVVQLGDPPIPANGGQRKGMTKFTGSFLKIPGQWQMILVISHVVGSKYASDTRRDFTIPNTPL